MALQKKSSRGYRESVSGLAKDPPPSVATDSNVPRLRSSSTLKASPSAQQRTRDAQTFRRQTLTAVGRLQSQAQAHLSTAVTSERARQWHVVWARASERVLPLHPTWAAPRRAASGGQEGKAGARTSKARQALLSWGCGPRYTDLQVNPERTYL